MKETQGDSKKEDPKETEEVWTEIHPFSGGMSDVEEDPEEKVIDISSLGGLILPN